jgi:pimeloyl-ACP methyl ester carboxylesterase
MVELNYKEFGQGEPVIILHGLFGTLDNWQTIAKSLSAHFSVFLVDLRNHGRSPHTEGVFDYHILADDIAHFMQQNWIYEACVIGHSMGGKVAMQLALSYPDLVKKLVIIDIAAKTYPSGHDEIFEALFSINLTTLTDRKEAEAHLMQQLNNDIGTVQFLLKNLSRKSASVPISDDDRNIKSAGFEWKMNLHNIYTNYPNILKNVEGSPFDKKALFIRGGSSNYVQDKDLEQIKHLFPNAVLETIEGAGHWVHADKPKELLDVITSFL